MRMKTMNAVARGWQSHCAARKPAQFSLRQGASIIARQSAPAVTTIRLSTSTAKDPSTRPTPHLAATGPSDPIELIIIRFGVRRFAPAQTPRSRIVHFDVTCRVVPQDNASISGPLVVICESTVVVVHWLQSMARHVPKGHKRANGMRRRVDY